MICPRCGAMLNPEQRYCMKCGALNYEHPDNQKMKQYITEQELEQANQEYQKVANGSNQTIEIAGKVYSDTPVIDKKTMYVDTRTMLSLLLIFTICLGAIYYFIFPYSIRMTLVLCLVFFALGLCFITNMAVYMKGGYSGFSLFVPFYSLYAFCDVALGNGWLFLITLIPIVGVVFLLYAFYKLGKFFGKSGWLTLFFPFIMLPVIAFSDKAIYSGPGKKYKRYFEKGKKRNTLIPALICSTIIFFLFLGFTQTPFALMLSNYFTQRDIAKVLDTVKKDINDGIYTCNGEILGSKDGDYYIAVKDLSDIQNYPIPIRSSLNGRKMYGYFLVRVSKNKSRVLVNLTDGNYVFSEIEPIDISIPENAVLCSKTN